MSCPFVTMDAGEAVTVAAEGLGHRDTVTTLKV
jgi:hypothetical protein